MHPSDPLNPPAVVGMLLSRALPECSATAIADLGALFHRHAVAKGGGLLSQGQVWCDALLVEQGLLRLYFVRRDGREFNKNFFTDGALFCGLLIGVILILGGLLYFPALALGPIVEHLLMLAGKTF